MGGAKPPRDSLLLNRGAPMKAVREQVSLAGSFEEITVSDFRASPGEAFASVALGKTFLLTKNGKAVAVLSPPPGDTLAIEILPDGSWRYGPAVESGGREHG